MKCSHRKPRIWTDTLVRLKKRKRDIGFGTWDVKSQYRLGSLTAAARELARCKLDLEGVQEVRWDRGVTVRAGDYNFYMENGTKIVNWKQDVLYTTEQYH